MKKKILLAMVGTVSVLTLAACSSGSNADIATLKGGKITVEDFYDQAKLNSTNQGIVRDMIIYKVMDNKYGDKVTKDMVNEEFDKTKEQLGDNLDSQLQAAGYTEATYKDYLRNNLVLKEGLKAHIKLTDDDLKAAWDSFHPEVEAQIIAMTSEEDAKKVQEDAKKDDADFAKLAKENSVDTTTKDDGGKIKFDSQSTTVPAEVKEAAFKLKDGEVSDVISSTSSTTYTTTYYIVKMDKNKAKGNSMDPYKDEIEEIATNTKLNDQTFVMNTISEELKEANVKIKDSAFDNVLSGFVSTDDSASSTDSSEKASDQSSESTATSESAAATDSTDSSK
ncbi:foldase PrsA [Enterococcus canis]|uniref:Foldase protein PrsA n=1 Tax=Enterococcus canis TaxID=214095 RepID=A0A1L8REQ1_9ENTE|nr:peptidylprolyl isomerase [Enterococcus canis]OJG18204.1 foldase PrsA [Enterococcus canis]